MTIEEAIDKIGNAKPVKAVTLYGDDILWITRMDTTEYDEADACITKYIAKHNLVNEILETAGIILANDEMIFESINQAVIDAIYEVIGEEKYKELVSSRWR